MRSRFGLPGLPRVFRSMSLRFPSVGGERAETRQWARIRSWGPPAEGVGSSVRWLLLAWRAARPCTR